MNKFFGFSVLVVVVAVLAPPVSAGNYTGPGLAAEIEIRDPRLGSGRYTGTYHFDRGGYRIDISGRARIKTFIFNSFNNYFISVGSNKRMEIDEDKHGALAMRFGDLPCAGFRNSLSVGTDNRAGRELQVWRCEHPKQELRDAGYRQDHRETVWYDAALKHFIRKETTDGVKIELKKIIPGRQSPSLFDMPGESSAAVTTTRVADVETVE